MTPEDIVARDAMADQIMALIPRNATPVQIEIAMHACEIMLASLAMTAFGNPEEVIVSIANNALATVHKKRASLAAMHVAGHG
jgi:hypothetical protein